MGGSFGSLFKSLFGKKEMRILMGLLFSVFL